MGLQANEDQRRQEKKDDEQEVHATRGKSNEGTVKEELARKEAEKGGTKDPIGRSSSLYQLCICM